MNIKPMTDTIAMAAEQNVKRHLRDDDYIGDDGFLHCGKCGKARQTKVKFFGEDCVVWCICNCRDEELKAAEREQLRTKVELLKTEGFTDPAMRDSTFDVDEDPESEASVFCRNYVKNFSTLYERGKGLLLTGGVGTGKTFYAACIANALMDNLHPVLFTSLGRYIQGMEDEFGGKNEKIDHLNRFALVVFDDFGVERNSPYIKQHIFSIIDARIRSGKPMIITTNIPLKDFKEPGGMDESRIYDRILSKCLPVSFNGKNHRRINIKREYENDMNLLRGGG